MARMNFGKLRVSQKIANEKRDAYLVSNYAIASKIKIKRNKNNISSMDKCKSIIGSKKASYKQQMVAKIYIENRDKKYVKLINSIAETLSNRLGESMIT